MNLHSIVFMVVAFFYPGYYSFVLQKLLVSELIKYIDPGISSLASIADITIA